MRADIYIELPAGGISWLEKCIDFSSTLAATLVGAIIGALFAGGIAWWIARTERQDARAAANEERWKQWADEIGDLATGTLLRTSAEFAGATITLQLGQRAAATGGTARLSTPTEN